MKRRKPKIELIKPRLTRENVARAHAIVAYKAGRTPKRLRLSKSKESEIRSVLTRKRSKKGQNWYKYLLQHYKPGKIAKFTKLPAGTIAQVQRGKAKLRPENRKKLYRAYRSFQSARMKKQGLDREIRKRYSGSTPDLIKNKIDKLDAYAKQIAKYYKKDLWKIKKGMAKSKRTEEEFDIYMKNLYPWIFDEKPQIDLPMDIMGDD